MSGTPVAAELAMEITHKGTDGEAPAPGPVKPFSPLPWSVSASPDVVAEDAQGRPIVTLGYDGHHLEVWDADERAIVEAVNAHQGLVAEVAESRKRLAAPLPAEWAEVDARLRAVDDAEAERDRVVREHYDEPVQCAGCGSTEIGNIECQTCHTWATKRPKIDAADHALNVARKALAVNAHGDVGRLLAALRGARAQVEEHERRAIDIASAGEALLGSLGEYARQSMYFNPEWKSGIVAMEAALAGMPLATALVQMRAERDEARAQVDEQRARADEEADAARLLAAAAMDRAEEALRDAREQVANAVVAEVLADEARAERDAAVARAAVAEAMAARAEAERDERASAVDKMGDIAGGQHQRAVTAERKAERAEQQKEAIAEELKASLERKRWLAEEVTAGLAREADLRAKLRVVETDTDGVWRWMDGEENDPKSLSCPVVMGPKRLNAFVAAEAEVVRLRGDLEAVRGAHAVAIEDRLRLRDEAARLRERLTDERSAHLLEEDRLLTLAEDVAAKVCAAEEWERDCCTGSDRDALGDLIRAARVAAEALRAAGKPNEKEEAAAAPEPPCCPEREAAFAALSEQDRGARSVQYKYPVRMTMSCPRCRALPSWHCRPVTAPPAVGAT